MKIVGKALEAIVITIIVILLLFNIYNLFSKYVLKKDMPNIFGYSYFIVKSNSMLTDIKINDLIIIKLNEPYEVGDIVTYKEGKEYITHRVVAINDDTIITKGDNNNANDDAISKDQIVGVVIKIVGW